MSDICDRIDLKLRRLYHALETARVEHVGVVPFDTRQAHAGSGVIDFRAGSNEAADANVLLGLVASIASLKDYLKAWCVSRGAPFAGDTLINSNRDVAIVHDLWNLDKHAELQKSRSGLSPTLRHIGRGMMVRPPAGEKAVSVSLCIAPFGLYFSGKQFVGVDASVVDSAGKHLGSALEIAERAIEAWETEYRSSGIPLPPVDPK